MAKTSPTQRSLKHIRELGFHAQVVERYNSFAHVRVDLFQWIDIVAVNPKVPILGIQTTTKGNMGARLEKARGNAALMAWLLNGSLELHGWRKLKGRWVVDVHRITLDDLISKDTDSTTTDGATGS